MRGRFFKFGFGGERGRTPKRNFLKEVPLWTLFKNFPKSIIYQCFLKVFEIPKNFFQKVLWWGAGATPLPDKLQFPTQTKREKPIGLSLSFSITQIRAVRWS